MAARAPAARSLHAAALAAAVLAAGLACARLMPPSSRAPALPKPAPGSPPGSPAARVEFNTQPDGSIEVIDHDLGLRFSLPGAWWAVRLEGLPFEAVLEPAAALHPDLAPLLEAIGPGLSERARMVAVQADPAAVAAGAPRSAVLGSPGPMRLPLPALLEMTALALQAIAPGGGPVERSLEHNRAGMDIGRLHLQVPLTLGSQTAGVLEIRAALFEAADRLAALVLIGPAGEPGNLSAFDAVLDSLTLAPVR